MGKRERILVCTGGVAGPDRPWLKGKDKLSNKWKVNGAALQVVGHKWVIKVSFASHILQSIYDISGNFGRRSQAIFHTQLLRRFKIFSSTAYIFFFLIPSANKTSVLK